MDILTCKLQRLSASKDDSGENDFVYDAFTSGKQAFAHLQSCWEQIVIRDPPIFLLPPRVFPPAQTALNLFSLHLLLP